MFRPPFFARVAAGAVVYAIEETRRLPTVAVNLPITAISQMLQTTMHVQQFVTSLALKGDTVLDQLVNRPVEQPEWATFDEDEEFGQIPGTAPDSVRMSRFELFTALEEAAAAQISGNGSAADDLPPASVATTAPEAAEPPAATEPPATEPPAAESAGQPAAEPTAATEPARRGAIEPEVAGRYDYANMTLAQLRARLRMLSVEDLTALLEYEQQTFDRAPFVTMLTNRIATVQAK